MSENTPSSDNGGLNDPLKLRNTDTGTLKRVPAANPSLASSAARKTIKLKPLTAKPDAAAPVSTATVTMGHVPPPASSAAPAPAAPGARVSSTSTVPLSAHPGTAAPSGAATQKFVSTMTAQMTAAGVVPPKGDEKFVATTTGVLSSMPPPAPPAAPVSPEAPARFASTTTAPISPAPAPTPVPKPNLGASPAAPGTTTTQAIPKIKPVPGGRPVVNLASSGGAIKPGIAPAAAKPVVPTTTEGLPKAKPTPGLMPKGADIPTTTEELTKPKLSTASTPPAAPAAPASTATQGIPKARPVIAPKPVVNLSEMPPPPKPATTLTATQNLPKASSQSTLAAVSQSGFQTAKPAIKLRPSAAPEQAAAVPPPAMMMGQAKPASAPPPATPSVAPAASAQTIKLSPRPASAVSPLPPTPAAEVAPEISPAATEGAADAPEDTRTTKLPKKTVSLKPAAAPKPSDPTVSLHLQSDIPTTKKSEITAEEQTIALKGVAPEAEKEADAASSEGLDAAPVKTEPSLLFTITAGVAVIILLFMAYALTAQYLNLWEEKSMPVVIFEQIRGK